MVMRHPVIVILLVAGLLATLLYPVTHMKVGIPEASVLPEKYESRAGDDILKENFEYAVLNPMEIVATLPHDPLSAEGLADAKASASASGTPATSRTSRASTRWGGRRRRATPSVSPQLARGPRLRPTAGWRRGSKGSSRRCETSTVSPPGAEAEIRAEAERRAAEGRAGGPRASRGCLSRR